MASPSVPTPGLLKGEAILGPWPSPGAGEPGRRGGEVKEASRATATGTGLSFGGCPLWPAKNKKGMKGTEVK